MIKWRLPHGIIPARTSFLQQTTYSWIPWLMFSYISSPFISILRQVLHSLHIDWGSELMLLESTQYSRSKNSIATKKTCEHEVSSQTIQLQSLDKHTHKWKLLKKRDISIRLLQEIKTHCFLRATYEFSSLICKEANLPISRT